MPNLTLTLDLTPEEDAMLREAFADDPGCYSGVERALLDKMAAAYARATAPAPMLSLSPEGDEEDAYVDPHPNRLTNETARPEMICRDLSDGGFVKLDRSYESWVWECAVWLTDHWSYEGDRIHVGGLVPLAAEEIAALGLVPEHA